MPEGIKEKALMFLSSQTPRVLIAIITIGALCGMSWFGKLTDMLAITITLTGVVAQIMNYLSIKKKEGDS